MASKNYKYWPKYCEENVWHLCQYSQFENLEKKVVLISNANKSCALWCQQAAPGSELPVVWDYHVVLFVLREQWTAWDLDSTLQLGTTVADYLASTFPENVLTEPQFIPRFRVFQGTDYVQSFSSDRSHMLDTDGNWIAEPPPWPPMVRDGAEAFYDWISMNSERSSDTFSLDRIIEQFGAKT